MNKTELVAAIAEKAGLSKKDAEGAVKAFTDTVAEQLKAGEKIQLVVLLITLLKKIQNSHGSSRVKNKISLRKSRMKLRKPK